MAACCVVLLAASACDQDPATRCVMDVLTFPDRDAAEQAMTQVPEWTTPHLMRLTSWQDWTGNSGAPLIPVPKPRRRIEVTVAGEVRQLTGTEYRTTADGTLRVLDGAREAVRFGPGEWQDVAIHYEPDGAADDGA